MSVNDYLDDVGRQMAYQKMDDLNESLDDDMIIHCGVSMRKKIFMHLYIEDLANARCERRQKLPFLCQDLNYDVVENLRLSLISAYDAEFSDDKNTSITSDSTSSELNVSL